MHFYQSDSHQNDANNVIDITTDAQINFQKLCIFAKICYLQFTYSNNNGRRANKRRGAEIDE